MKKYRVYADTSVFGGCFDDEFAIESKQFFESVKNGLFTLIISPVLIAEINEAPSNIQKILHDLPINSLEYISYSDDIGNLRDLYLKEKILTVNSKSDAEHVATATIHNADFIISWNFKHIVHYDKISGFNSVNIKNGYKLINIYSPKEVI